MFLPGIHTARRGLRRGLNLVLLLSAAALCGARGDPVESRLVDERFVLFAAPRAASIAVSDALQKVAVGFEPGCPEHVWLLKLDDKGDIVSAPPRPLALPDSEGPDGRAGHVAGMIFHPRLPLLYAWRHFAEPEEDETVPDTFDHLVVFDLSDPEKPDAVLVAGRGGEFTANSRPAHLGMDPGGRRLFVPNLRVTLEDEAVRAGVGYFPLDGSGLPLLKDGRPQLVSIAVSGSQPTGFGFLAANERVLLMSVTGSLLTWDTVDRRAERSHISLRGMRRRSGFIGGDAERVYWACRRTGVLHSMRHVDGYPTLLPVSHTVSGARFCSPPIRMSGDRPVLAVGGAEQVHLIGLTPAGEFSGEDASLPLHGINRVSVLDASERFDRLYVASQEFLDP